MPSAKKAFCLSSLRFSNGRTAMLFSEIAGLALSVPVGGDRVRLKKSQMLKAAAATDNRRANPIRTAGNRGGVTARISPVRDLGRQRPVRRSFVGTCG